MVASATFAVRLLLRNAESAVRLSNPSAMEAAGEVVIVAPGGATAGAIFHALLTALGWSVSLYTDESVENAFRSGVSILALLEDDTGALGIHLPDNVPLVGVVCVGSIGSIATLIRYARRGARVLNQSVPIAVLSQAVQAALRAPRPAPGSPDEVPAATVGELILRQQEAHRLGTLTAAESEVLREIVAGRSAAEIATRTHHSVHTVRSHLKAILSKLEVNTQVAAVAVAHRSGGYGWLHMGPARFTNFGDEAS